MYGFDLNIPETAVAMTFWRLLERFLDFFTPDCGTYRNFTVDSRAVGICLFGIFAGVLVAILVSAYEKSLHADFIGVLTDLDATDKERAVTLAVLGFSGNRRVKREFRDGVGLSNYVRCVEEEAWKAIEWTPVGASGTAEPAESEAGHTTSPLTAEQTEASGVTEHTEVSGNGGSVASPDSGALENAAAAVVGTGTNEEPDATATAGGTGESPRPPFRFDFETAHFYLPEEKRIAAEVRYAPQKKRVGGLLLTVLALVAVYILMVFVTPGLLQLADNCLGLLGG